MNSPKISVNIILGSKINKLKVKYVVICFWYLNIHSMEPFCLPKNNLLLG